MYNHRLDIKHLFEYQLQLQELNQLINKYHGPMYRI